MLLFLGGWSPKKLAESENFFISLKKTKPSNRLSVGKNGEKPRTIAFRTQHSAIPCVLPNNHGCADLKKQHTKNKWKTAAKAKLLAKRMEEAKENGQEPIAKRQRLFSRVPKNLV